jgi:hypothetical protein
MPLEVALYQIPNHRRSRLVCEAMARGIRKCGDKTWTVGSPTYRISDIKPVSIFYGMSPPLAQALKEIPAAGGTAIYVDLGYWGRHEGGRYRGFHKICINGRHPNSYFQKRTHDDSRLRALGVTVQPWRDGGRHILLAGMSGRAAPIDGFAPNEWELGAITEICRHTDRPIVYRPKPSWQDASPLAGTTYSPSAEPLGNALADCHAVVTHHSNVAVDALVVGVPVFCWAGVAAPMGDQRLAAIEIPVCPEGREAWAADVSFTQWSIAEMGEGLPWRHLKAEGLIA